MNIQPIDYSLRRTTPIRTDDSRRMCERAGCGVVLSRYNLGVACGVHERARPFNRGRQYSTPVRDRSTRQERTL